MILAALRAVRSFVSMLLVGAYFTLGSIVLRLGVIPTTWLWPQHRYAITSPYFKAMARGIFALLTLGGARFRRRGVLPTATPIVVVANHQALTDILQASLLGRPFAPAFVSRTRYARFVPLVSATIRLLGCPLVDPKRNPRGALEAIRQGGRELPHGLLIFPEGHRSVDGTVRPFHQAGLQALLEAKRVPVYLVVNEGAWRVRTFLDLLYRVHLLDASSEVLGPLEIPEDPLEIPAFIARCREIIVARLVELRGGPPPEGPERGSEAVAGGNGESEGRPPKIASNRDFRASIQPDEAVPGRIATGWSATRRILRLSPLPTRLGVMPDPSAGAESG
jgi:1-acyl-sn-glycerol-3-phosphate acyltransferase